MNVVITGVGGQGTVLASKIIAAAATTCYDYSMKFIAFFSSNIGRTATRA